MDTQFLPVDCDANAFLSLRLKAYRYSRKILEDVFNTTTMHNPELYEKYNKSQRRQCELLLNEVAPHLSWQSSNQKILDIGCAPGDFTAQLIPRIIPADKCWKIVGFDISPEMVEHARKHYSNPNIKFVLGDIADPNIEASPVWQEAPFQKIFSFFCLHFLEDKRVAFRNIFKLLDDEGDTVLTFLPREFMLKLNESVINHPKWNAYFKNYPIPTKGELLDSSEEITALLESLGFQVHFCRYEVKSRNIESLDEVLDYLSHINYYEEYIPEKHREEFILDYLEMFKKLNLIKQLGTGYEKFTPKFTVHASKNKKSLNTI